MIYLLTAIGQQPDASSTVPVYPAVLLMYFISAAVILLPSLAITVHVSLPYNKTGGPVYCIILFLFPEENFFWSKHII